MRKQNRRSLKLVTETLRVLSGPTLRQAAGGSVIIVRDPITVTTTDGGGTLDRSGGNSLG